MENLGSDQFQGNWGFGKDKGLLLAANPAHMCAHTRKSARMQGKGSVAQTRTLTWELVKGVAFSGLH